MVLVAAAAAACAARPVPGGAECVPAMEPGLYVIASPPGKQTLGTEPFTAECRLPAAVVERLRSTDGKPGAAVLWVEGLQLPRDETVTVNVHLGEAGGPLPAFAGSFTLLPDEGGGRPRRVQVPVGSTLRKVRDGSRLAVALVALDAEGRPAGSGLSFDRIVLEVSPG